MKELLEQQKQKQIDFLKELSYEEINDMLREYKVKLKNLKAENERLKEAAEKLVFLHQCEQEGIESGQPTAQDWFEAVNQLGELLTPKE